MGATGNGGWRLAAVDLDGTLLRSDLSLSDRTRAALDLAATRGVTVVIATARSPRSVRAIAADAGLAGLAICANGAILFDLTAERIVEHRPLSAETVRRLARELREQLPGIVFGWEHELRFGSEPAYEAQREERWWPRPEGSYAPCEVDEWELPVTKLIGRLPPGELEGALALAVELADGEASATLTGTAFVELMAPGVGKGSALAGLAERHGLVAAEVVAFGDQVTDAEMLAWAGHGVAVANAHPLALAAADEVTASNDEDGVARVLERLLA